MQGPDGTPIQAFRHEFGMDVMRGLSASQKFLPPKYFYDETGSRLFEQICFQREYYIARTESEILKRQSQAITKECNAQNRINIIELGSGSSLKTRILFRSLVVEAKREVHYYPIDISRTALVDTVNMLSTDFPNLRVNEIIADYESGVEQACQLLSLCGKDIQQSKLILFLGSSIGNLDPLETVVFLRMLRRNMNDSDSLLIGFDLEKDLQILEDAYNDNAGVTARFNLNILERINKELSGHFDLSSFAHRSYYNKNEHRMEMHLTSQVRQSVKVDLLEKDFEFQKGETIHTENSYKYTFDRIEELASQCGLRALRHFTDEKKWFDLCLLKVA